MGISGVEFVLLLFLMYVFFIIAQALIAMPITAITGDSKLGHAIGSIAAGIWMVAILLREQAIVWWGVYLW